MVEPAGVLEEFSSWRTTELCDAVHFQLRLNSTNEKLWSERLFQFYFWWHDLCLQHRPSHRVLIYSKCFSEPQPCFPWSCPLFLWLLQQRCSPIRAWNDTTNTLSSKATPSVKTITLLCRILISKRMIYRWVGSVPLDTSIARKRRELRQFTSLLYAPLTLIFLLLAFDYVYFDILLANYRTTGTGVTLMERVTLLIPWINTSLSIAEVAGRTEPCPLSEIVSRLRVMPRATTSTWAFSLSWTAVRKWLDLATVDT